MLAINIISLREPSRVSAGKSDRRNLSLWLAVKAKTPMELKLSKAEHETTVGMRYGTEHHWKQYDCVS